MFGASAEFEKFDEAVDWFSQRLVLTEAEAIELGKDAGRRAFWIGNGLQLAQVQRVFDEIKKAEAAGEPFEEWRKRVRGELPNDAHAETVFRNAAQRALNAGRWQQMHEPSVLKFRPYLMFDAVLDGHTSQVCIVCNKTTLPAEHPWWLTHAPPLHHRCRSGLRSLRREVAERKGITNVPPAIESQDGFGLAPDAQPVWKPDPKKHDPELTKELERKAKKEPKPPAPPKEAPKEHDPKHWEGVYAAKYGEAAANVGWGRAMLERGLDRSPADVKAELKRLIDLGYPQLSGGQLLWLDQLEQNRPLRLQLVGNLPRQRALIALQEHTRTIKPGYFPDFGSEEHSVGQARTFYKLALDRSVQRPDVRIEWRSGVRAYFSSTEKLVVLDPRESSATVVHELAHAIEEVDARALARSQAFLSARTRGERLQRLNQLKRDAGYDDSEEARPDEFIHPYIGKDYGKYATEVTSMGYELLATSPSADRSYINLSERDPEMLWFLLGQLAGR